MQPAAQLQPTRARDRREDRSFRVRPQRCPQLGLGCPHRPAPLPSLGPRSTPRTSCSRDVVPRRPSAVDHDLPAIRRSASLTVFSSVPSEAVDSAVEEVWTTCGAACGQTGSHRACESVWTDRPVVHSEVAVLNTVVHSREVVPNDEMSGYPLAPQTYDRSWRASSS